MKKLRKIGDEMDSIEDCYETAFEEIDAIIYNGGYENFFQRLADLIDPTSHQVIEDETQVCSECSGDLDEEYGWDFCPWCGARVVRDDS